MYENLLAFAEQTVAAGTPGATALPEALQISGIALLAIFFVMGLFGAMITLFSFVFPETDDESE
jgi:hypothetical protein